jgi:hypothetical protein
VEHDCRLVVTGDRKQHHSVQWGDAVRISERSGAIGQAVLSKIYRHRIPELRKAIEDLSNGRTAKGFDKLDKSLVVREDSCSGDLLSVLESPVVLQINRDAGCSPDVTSDGT